MKTRQFYALVILFIGSIQRPGNHTQLNGLSFGILANGSPEWRLELLKSRSACLFDQLRLRKYLVQINFESCFYVLINQDIPENCNGFKEPEKIQGAALRLSELKKPHSGFDTERWHLDPQRG